MRAGADLVIVAHGERGGAGDNRALARLAAAVAKAGGFASVRAGVLKGSPSFEQALDASRDRDVQVYPLFMSDGHYVRSAVPERLGLGLRRRDRTARDALIHRPFGLEPGLAAVIARFAVRSLGRFGGDLSDGILLLVGHGSSKSDDSRAATEWQAARVRTFGLFAEVRTAYLENAPFLPDALKALPASPCVVVGLFTGEGQHATEDVPGVIEAAGRRDIIYAGPICAAPDTARLIAASVRSAARG